jgi:hypothetical protein
MNSRHEALFSVYVDSIRLEVLDVDEFVAITCPFFYAVAVQLCESFGVRHSQAEQEADVETLSTGLLSHPRIETVVQRVIGPYDGRGLACRNNPHGQSDDGE